MPKVSIVMPTFNAATYLPETIESVLRQSYETFELIIVDDCSTDNTGDIISSFADDRIKYISLEKNHGGPSLPRNVGVAASSGRYVSFFDSDDIMLPGKIEAGVAALEDNSSLAMVFTDAIKIYEDGVEYAQNLLEGYTGLTSLLTSKNNEDVHVLQPEDAFDLLFEENYIPTSSVMARRNILLETGPFDERLLNGDDRDLWYRVTRNHAIGFIDKALHKYRIRGQSVSKGGIRTARNRIRVLEKQLSNGLPRALEKKAMKLLAKNYWGIGYAFRIQGEMRLARTHFAESFRCRSSLKTVRSYLATFLGERLLGVLRPQ